MVSVGDYYWEVELDPVTANQYYLHASSWLTAIRNKEAHLDRFAVETRCRVVTASPAAMRTADDWGNVEWTETRPGTLVNHRDTPWYVGYWRVQVALRRLGCYIMQGQGDAALKLLPIINQEDPQQAVVAQRAWPTIAKRLTHDTGEGRLFASRAELAAFPKQVMPHLLIAELAYKTERYAHAARLYGQIRRDHCDQLSADARAYLSYHEALALPSSERSRVLRILSLIAKNSKTSPAWPRVKKDLFVMTQTLEPDGGGELTYLDDIIAALPGSPEALEESYAKACFLAARQRTDEARSIFQSIRKAAPGSWLAQGANRYLLSLGPEKIH